MFTYVYSSLSIFTTVYSFLPMFNTDYSYLLTYDYTCLLVFTYVYTCLPLFMPVYSCLPISKYAEALRVLSEKAYPQLSTKATEQFSLCNWSRVSLKARFHSLWNNECQRHLTRLLLSLCRLRLTSPLLGWHQPLWRKLLLALTWR